MLVELHILQNFAPSCLNRDDTNSPKECEFGGYRRARISSQCLKRAIRTSGTFKNHIGEDIAVRSKRIHKLIKDMLLERGISEEGMDDIIGDFIPHLYASMEKSRERKTLTSVALYVGHRELGAIADKLYENWKDLTKDSKKAAEKLGRELAKVIKDTYAADIGLFGRMMAEKPALNINAACQVAHAISTNRVNMEMDFFTAVDDLLPTGETGAGMMGIVEYNSSCFYRYAAVDLGQLMGNLHNDSSLAPKTLKGFLHASIEAIPTGKQNSMAAQNPPSLVLAVVRNGHAPWSLANAFVQPIQPDRDLDLIEGSIAAIDRYWGDLTKAYGGDGITTAAVCQVGADRLENLRQYEVHNVASLIESVMAAAEFPEQTL